MLCFSFDDVLKLLKGMGILCGIVSGCVCLVCFVGEVFEKLFWGDILVCFEIGFDWIFLFFIVGGLVIELFVGGMLLYVVLVVCEYWIFVIFGIKSVCLFFDGWYVDLDGIIGLVEIGRCFELMWWL